MGRIKGPMVIKGFKSSEFMADRIMEAAGAGTIKLPFSATGFSCTKIPPEVSLEGIKFAEGFDQKNPKLILPKGKKVKVEDPKIKEKPKESALEKVVEKVKEVVGVKAEGLYNTFDDLTKIKGIGRKTATDLKKNYKTLDALRKVLYNDAIYDKLRDDVVDLLRKELGE